MNIKNLILACVFIPCICVAAPVVNDGSFLSVNWTGTSTLAGFGTTAGTGGTTPSIIGGDLTLSMVGATAGKAEVRKSSLVPPTYPLLTDYVITTRASVEQFSGVAGTGNGQIITLANILSYDQLSIGVNATQVLVLGPSGGRAIDLPSGLTNTPGVFYTWQFEVHQDAGTTAGTVDIYRRDYDSGDTWDVIATKIPILNYTTTPTATNVYFGRVNYSTSGNQGILKQDYFTMAAIPEPPHVTLLTAGLGALILWQRRNRSRMGSNNS